MSGPFDGIEFVPEPEGTRRIMRGGREVTWADLTLVDQQLIVADYARCKKETWPEMGLDEYPDPSDLGLRDRSGDA